MRWIAPLAIAALLAAPVQSQPRLGIAGTEPSSGGYDAVLDAMAQADVHVTSLSLFWDEFDIAGTYAPATDWAGIANQVYPDLGIALTLTIPVIDTVADRRPEDLRHLSWDDPMVLARFTRFIDRVLGDMADVEILTLAIGNEVDGHLVGTEAWRAYVTFFTAARAHVRRTHPDLTIGVTMTWNNLRRDPRARDLAEASDAWFVNWYPLAPGYEVLPPDTFAPTLDLMRELAGDQPLYLTEAGYPSGGCGGSAEGQEAFVRTVVEAQGIELAMLVWLHDLGPGEAHAYASYYGTQDACFIDYLSTLGLRSHTGFDKPAFGFLRSR